MRLIDWYASKKKYFHKDVTIEDDTITENVVKKNNSTKKYYITFTLFLVCLVMISHIKNKTRSLQKEISNLRTSILSRNFELHKAILDHELITSPKNITRLANEYLEINLTSYKVSQIKVLKEDQNVKNVEKSLGIEKLAKNSKEKVLKKIKNKKDELKKLQKIYSEPSKLPTTLKNEVAKKIEVTKDEIKKMYKDPGSIDGPRIRRWAGIQIVKVFFGIPIVPGR
jgi:hypothetical protein